MNIKSILIFGAGVVVGAGGVGGFAIYKARKADKAYEAQIAEVKQFYSDRFDEAVVEKANEYVKEMIFSGKLVYPKNSVDTPEIVSAEDVTEVEDEAADNETDDDGNQAGPSGPDPPEVVVKNFFETHRKAQQGEGVVVIPDPEGQKLRDRTVSQSELSEAALAMREELAEARPNYVKYSSYSRAAQRRETQQALAEYEAEKAEYNESLEIEQQYNEEGNLILEDGTADPLAEQHISELAPTEKTPIPFVISQESFEEEYVLYGKETLFYYMPSNILAFENMEVIDDPAMYVGTIAPITLFPRINGATTSDPVYIRNHMLGMDFCVYASAKTYEEDMELSRGF